MLQPPPAARERTDWIAVAGCALAIFVTVPFAPLVRDAVDASVGREVFTYAVIATVVVLLAAVLARLRRHRLPRSARAWLVVVAALYAWYAWRLRAIPEEAVHLLEYLLLGVLAFRALSHRVRDATIYASTVALGAIVGIVDEALQWLAPNRHWTLADIWINVAAVALAVLAIALGLRPPYIRVGISAHGARRFARLAAIVVVLLALTFFNTPQRIEWLAANVPGLAFLRTNESVMFEYGYRYDDADTGVFRSRLAPADLAATDERRADDAGAVLAAYPDDRYKEFLSTYTPVNDPFVHEARVHLFSRDKHLRLARSSHVPPTEHGWHATVAWRENRILEKYFGRTLERSTRALDPADRTYLDRVRVPLALVPEDERESWVSRSLVTDVREPQIMAGLTAVLAVLLAIEGVAARSAKRAPTREKQG
jgi:VanZ family protein